MTPFDTISIEEAVNGKPYVDVDYLINQLDTLYPDTYPDFTMSHIEIAYRGGQVSVVRKIKQLLRGDPL